MDKLRVNLAAYGANHGGSIGAFVGNELANKIGQGEGAVLEGIDTVSGVVSLAHNVSELTNPATYVFDPQSNISRLKTTASTLRTLNDVMAAASQSPQFAYGLVKTYVGSQYQGFQQDPAKYEGRFGVKVASIFAGGPLTKAGEVTEGLNALERAQEAANGLERTAGLVPSNAPGSSLFKLGNVFEDSGVNAAADQAFEQGQMVRRLSVRAFDENGNLLPGRTVLDAFGTSLDSGEFGALEFKLSENAPYTDRQLEHFPYLQQYGGVVVGNNGRAIGLPAGSVLDPFPINRINGPQLPAPGEWWK